MAQAHDGDIWYQRTIVILKALELSYLNQSIGFLKHFQRDKYYFQYNKEEQQGGGGGEEAAESRPAHPVKPGLYLVLKAFKYKNIIACSGLQ